MPLIPLVPLNSTLVPTASAVGFDPGAGINRETPPEVWSPDPDIVRTASFPTPLALAQSTLMLLRREGVQHELLLGAELLLQGLVAGVLELEWVPVDELRPSGLRSALRAYLGAQHAKIGLLRHVQGERSEVWGSITVGGVPCLAGAKRRAVAELNAMLGPVQGLNPKVVALLNAVRDPLRSANQWDPAVPWMALVDRVRAKLGESGQVDLCEDVRSIGPFDLPVPSSAGGPTTPQSFYLLGHAPGFVLRLARCLTCTPRRPGEPGAQDPHHIELLQGPGVVARFRRVAGRPVPAMQLGEGLACWVTDRFAGRAPRIDTLSRSALLIHDFGPHLDALRSRLGGSMVEALTNAPYRLTDVARVAARHAPELVDDVSPQAYSPAFRAYQLRSGVDVRPSVADIERLRAEGRAFLLSPAQDATRPDLPVAVFLEDGSPEPERHRGAVGDLSGLGLALWMAFAGDSREVDGRFVDGQGGPLVDTGLVDFPAGPSDELADWWDTAEAASTALLLATVQRFLASYPIPSAAGPEESGVPGLAACAARCFAGRLLDDPAKPKALEAPGAGTGAAPGASRPVRLPDYGTLHVRVDPLR